MNRRAVLKMGAVAPLVGFGGVAHAAKDPIYTGIFSSVAVSGYDPVAYFTQSKPVKGKKAISLSWNGATWRFSSEENKALFEKNPEKYAPQYGGYCAYAVAKNSTASGDPEQWTIHDGKLYLNYNQEINDTWRGDMLNFIDKADVNWPNVLK